MANKERAMSKPKRYYMTAQHSESASIVPFLRDQAFDPDTVNLMSATIEKICGELGVKAQSPAGEVIAANIIELVRRGMRNPTALYLAAMSGLTLVN
jgi:hypothetical protein